MFGLKFVTLLARLRHGNFLGKLGHRTLVHELQFPAQGVAVLAVMATEFVYAALPNPAVGEGRFLVSMYACLVFFVIVILLACRLQRR